MTVGHGEGEMSDDYDFRVQVMDQIKMLRDHIDNLYRLVEFYECGCPSHRDQNGKITVNPRINENARKPQP